VELSRENNRLAAELAELALSKSAASDPPPEPLEGLGAQSCRCGEAAPYDFAMQMVSKQAGGIVEQVRALTKQAVAEESEHRGKQLDRIAELIKVLATQADLAHADAQGELRQRAAQLDGLAAQVKALAAEAGVAQSDAQGESRQRAAQLDGLVEQVKALAAEAGESKRRRDQLTDQSRAIVAKLADVQAVVAKIGPDKSAQGSCGNSSTPDMLALIMASRDEDIVISQCNLPKDRLKPLEYFLRGAMRSPTNIREDIAGELPRVAGGAQSSWNVLVSGNYHLLYYASSMHCVMSFGRLHIWMWRA